MLDNAIEKIKEAFPDQDIASAYEYSDCYVFDIVPKGYKKDKDGLFNMINNSFSYDKKSGDIKAFFPFDMSAEEYKKGRQVI